MRRVRYLGGAVVSLAPLRAQQALVTCKVTNIIRISSFYAAKGVALRRDVPRRFARSVRPSGIITTFLYIFAIIIEYDTLRKVRKLQIRRRVPKPRRDGRATVRGRRKGDRQ